MVRRKPFDIAFEKVVGYAFDRSRSVGITGLYHPQENIWAMPSQNGDEPLYLVEGQLEVRFPNPNLFPIFEVFEQLPPQEGEPGRLTLAKNFWLNLTFVHEGVVHQIVCTFVNQKLSTLPGCFDRYGFQQAKPNEVVF